MARKFGKTTTMSPHFYDYNYVINGVGGIGKTTMAYELGKIATGSNEGTFIITCGSEPKPKHIPGAFGDVAKNFGVFVEIVNDLCENREDYKKTKFVAIDSLDEYFRMGEDYVVNEWNSACKRAGDTSKLAKSIAQAYTGFQKGENRVVDLVLKSLAKLSENGYQLLFLGHTKTKSKEDLITGVKYEQLTCNLDNKYYNAIKDKVNLVAMCYFENKIENIVKKTNPFSKKETIKVQIPAGVENGMQITVRGEGHSAPRGGVNGDLLLVIDEVSHSQFKRDGQNLFYTRVISVTDAMLGCELTIPCLDGPYALKLDSGVQSGTVERLRGKGLPSVNGYGRGDVYVKILVWIPRKLRGSDKEAVEKLAQSSAVKPDPTREDRNLFEKESQYF